MEGTVNPILIAFGEAAAPQVVAFLKGLWAGRHPTEPPLNDEQVQALWPVVRDASIAKDDAFRAEGGG